MFFKVNYRSIYVSIDIDIDVLVGSVSLQNLNTLIIYPESIYINKL